MSFQDQYDLYKQGKIKQLNYNGSETRINIGIEDFNRMYKNPLNKYQEDNYVTASNIYEKAINKGVSEEYAREQAKKYSDMVSKGGDPWRWNAGDKTELAIKLMTQKAKSDKAASDARKTTATATANVMGNVAALAPGKELEMGVMDKPVMEKVLGLELNEKTGNLQDTEGLKALDASAYGMWTAKERAEGKGEEVPLDLGLATDIQPLGYVALDNVNGNKEYYVKAKVLYPDYW
jgi:hypothetical protein